MESFLESTKEEPASSVPPPPSEVSVRTMASDLASLGLSGGGPPQPVSMSFQKTTEGTVLSETKMRTLIWVGAIVLGIVVLFAIGYFVLPAIFGSQPKHAPTGTPSFTNTAPSTLSNTAPPSGVPYQSYFKTPADQTLQIVLSSGRSPYREAIPLSLSAVPESAGFFELSFSDSSGAPLTFTNFLADAEAPLLDQGVISSNFGPGFTGFLYRSGKIMSPGFVIALFTGKTPLLLQNTVRTVENNTIAIKNLFITDPGSPSGPFGDDQVSGQPVRVLSFANGSSTSEFLYGWFYNKYLVMSTSREGLAEALLHL